MTEEKVIKEYIKGTEEMGGAPKYIWCDEDFNSYENPEKALCGINNDDKGEYILFYRKDLPEIIKALGNLSTRLKRLEDSTEDERIDRTKIKALFEARYG